MTAGKKVTQAALPAIRSGTRAQVTKDVPDYAVVAGNPAAIV